MNTFKTFSVDIVLCLLVLCLPIIFTKPANAQEVFLSHNLQTIESIIKDNINRPVTINIDNQIIINGQFSIPENIHLNINRGGSFVVNVGSDLIINGTIDAVSEKIFFGNGKVMLTTPARPEWWGAVADGGTDSTKAIQLAVTSMGNSNSSINFARGTYIVTDSIKVTGSNLTLNGNGSSIRKILKPNGTAATIFKLINVKNIRIENFNLDGGYAGPSTGSNPVIQIGNTGGTPNMLNENVIVENNRIINGNHACVGVYGETDTSPFGNINITINNNSFHRAGSAVFVYKGAKNVVITNNIADDFGSAAIAVDTRAESDRNLTRSYPIYDVLIENNKISNVIGDHGFQPRGMTLKGAIYNITVKGNIIKNVIANDNAARPTYGIVVAKSFNRGVHAKAVGVLSGGMLEALSLLDHGSGYIAPPTVIIFGADGNGAKARATIKNGMVTGFQIENRGSGYSEPPSVQLVSGEVGANITITNNTIENVADNGAGGTTGWPIYIQSGFVGVNIANNKMLNCKRGLQIDAVANVNVVGNTLIDCPNNGLGISPIRVTGISDEIEATNVTVKNNVIIKSIPTNAYAIYTKYVKKLYSYGNDITGYK